MRKIKRCPISNEVGTQRNISHFTVGILYLPKCNIEIFLCQNVQGHEIPKSTFFNIHMFLKNTYWIFKHIKCKKCPNKKVDFRKSSMVIISTVKIYFHNLKIHFETHLKHLNHIYNLQWARELNKAWPCSSRWWADPWLVPTCACASSCSRQWSEGSVHLQTIARPRY